jgi:MoxR-like ATPase
MIKRVRSWDKDNSIPNLIGRKKVDWSIFEYGSHIPIEFHIDFQEANGGETVPIGQSRKLNLIIEDQIYEASLSHVNQSSHNRNSLQLRYDSNKELKSLMSSRFEKTYQYITTARSISQDGSKKEQIKVPDEQAEYIEFYSTGIPFQYELKLYPLDEAQPTQPKVWWVNQGSTLAAEQNEGILWAPMVSKNGGRQYHWDTMDEVQVGDIILHYANGALRFVSQVKVAAIPAKKPSSIGGSEWGQEGRLVRVNYHPLEKEIPLERFNEEIKNLNITQGPINSTGRVNQGYLFRFTIQGLKIIQQLSKISWPAFAIFQVDDQEVFVSNLTEQERLQEIKTYIAQKGFLYPTNLIENFYLSLKTKPFVILAGISGTGKTKLVKLFAEAIGATTENGQFNLIPVRPDWNDPSDLLGYKDLGGTFRPGPLTKVIIEASKPTNRTKPYFICLDEMNLARVEHYFSDILSILETQRREKDQVVTDPILKNIDFSIDDQGQYGSLIIPDNVYFIGTVNMDETTHPFSKKVLDRANTIEFNYIDLNVLPDLPNDNTDHVKAVKTSNEFLKSDYLGLIDVYPGYAELIQKVNAQLVAINSILEPIHSHFGFRVRDSICFYMIYNERFGLMDFDEALDQQLLQKILPRIQGSSQSVKRVLIELMFLATGDTKNLDDMLEDATELYKGWGLKDGNPEARYPQSARKIAYMLRRLEEDGFTSFWLS